MNQILVIDDNEDLLIYLKEKILSHNMILHENITLKSRIEFECLINNNLILSASIIFISESVVDYFKSKNETIEYFQLMKDLYKNKPFIISYSGRGMPSKFFGDIYISKYEFYANIMNPHWVIQIVN